jgi:hypothetical protein
MPHVAVQKNLVMKKLMSHLHLKKASILEFLFKVFLRYSIFQTKGKLSMCVIPKVMNKFMNIDTDVDLCERKQVLSAEPGHVLSLFY